ncbi:MAG: nickel-dependent lactate racemase [Anaerolineaceae bacterium]
MPTIQLAYGKSLQTCVLPESAQIDIIHPQDRPAAEDPQRVVRAALENPVGGITLTQFKGIHSAAIAINDKTRPVPHRDLLPQLLNALEALGIPPQKIQLVIATGTHTPMHPEEFSKILPTEIISRYPVISHDCDHAANLVNLGTTSRGTPVWVNRTFFEADLKIVVGNIEPHHFMGFSGGMKSASIGVTGRDTINHNHAMITHPNARSGHYDDNPMRQDVEEIGEKIGVQFALNAILNNEKAIVSVVAGKPRAVMQAGIPLSRQICQVPIHGQYDLVVASAGGYPKDINLYQSQKALTHAAMITRDGGHVILCTACGEGIGSQSYEDWMKGITSFDQVFAKFEREGFRVGPHKAFQIARDASRVHVTVVSEIPSEKLEKLLLHAAPDLQSAVNQALSTLPPNPRIAILPLATITVPEFQPSLSSR